MSKLGSSLVKNLMFEDFFNSFNECEVINYVKDGSFNFDIR
jgi:hypothetical protein